MRRYRYDDETFDRRGLLRDRDRLQRAYVCHGQRAAQCIPLDPQKCRYSVRQLSDATR
jgi:hypothetical protein